MFLITVYKLQIKVLIEVIPLSILTNNLKPYIKVIKPRTCLCRQTGSSDYTNYTNLDVDRIKANNTKIALKGNLFVKLVKIVNT